MYLYSLASKVEIFRRRSLYSNFLNGFISQQCSDVYIMKSFVRVLYFYKVRNNLIKSINTSALARGTSNIAYSTK